LDPRQQPKRGLFSPPRLALVLLAVGLGAWWLSRPGKPAPAETAEAETEPVAVAQPKSQAARAAPTAPPPAPAVAAPAPPAPEPAAEPELLIVPPGNDDPRPDGPLHPHPITPRHLRIQRENALLGQLNGAMDVEDGPGLRRLLDEYRRDYPEDPNQLQEGYAIIADCLEHPGAASRLAGQRYYERELGSTLRAFVQRHCFER
jgi:hypothetical protein